MALISFSLRDAAILCPQVTCQCSTLQLCSECSGGQCMLTQIRAYVLRLENEQNKRHRDYWFEVESQNAAEELRERRRAGYTR
jgi:hypothetical protein